METEKFPELHPDLLPYMEKMERYGSMIRHPLIFAVPYFGESTNEHLNKLLEFRREQLREALSSENYNLFVFTHERPCRLDAFEQIMHSLDEKTFNELLLEVYIDSENIHQNYQTWVELLDPLTGLDVWNSVSDLPDKIKIYRGGSKNGISWTLSLEKAQWFATRWNENLPVWEAEVNKEEIIGFNEHRNESEVIVSPLVLAGKVTLYARRV